MSFSDDCRIIKLEKMVSEISRGIAKRHPIEEDIHIPTRLAKRVGKNFPDS